MQAQCVIVINVDKANISANIQRLRANNICKGKDVLMYTSAMHANFQHVNIATSDRTNQYLPITLLPMVPVYVNCTDFRLVVDATNRSQQLRKTGSQD